MVVITCAILFRVTFEGLNATINIVSIGMNTPDISYLCVRFSVTLKKIRMHHCRYIIGGDLKNYSCYENG